MPNTPIDILGNLKLNQWYKVAIYLGGVLLVLDYIGLKVNNLVVVYSTGFAVESLILGLVVWILDDSIGMVGLWRIDHAYGSDDKNEIAEKSMLAIYVTRWIGLAIWIYIIVSTFGL